MCLMLIQLARDRLEAPRTKKPDDHGLEFRRRPIRRHIILKTQADDLRQA